MSTVSLSLPESLYKQVCKLAQEDGGLTESVHRDGGGREGRRAHDGRVPPRPSQTGEPGEV